MSTTFPSLKSVDYSWSDHAAFMYNNLPTPTQKIEYTNILADRLKAQSAIRNTTNTLVSCVIAKTNKDWSIKLLDIDNENTQQLIKQVTREVQFWCEENCEGEYGIYPEISFDDSVIKYTKDRQNYRSGSYLLSGPKGYTRISDKLIFRNFNGRKVCYEPSLYNCTVTLHFHLLVQENDYKKLQAGTKLDRVEHNIGMRKAKGTVNPFNKKQTSQYLTKINIASPKSAMRNGRYKSDLPVFNEYTGNVRLAWMKALCPIYTFESTKSTLSTTTFNEDLQTLRELFTTLRKEEASYKEQQKLARKRARMKKLREGHRTSQDIVVYMGFNDDETTDRENLFKSVVYTKVPKGPDPPTLAA